MSTNVLLATDGKPHSDKAVSYAIDYARRFEATLYIIYVVSPRHGEDREAVIKHGMGVLEALKERARKEGVTVSTQLEAGSPYEATLATAERVKADAIVVGTSGKTVVDRALIGSVSEYIVRNARCTVVVVR